MYVAKISNQTFERHSKLQCCQARIAENSGLFKFMLCHIVIATIL